MEERSWRRYAGRLWRHSQVAEEPPHPMGLREMKKRERKKSQKEQWQCISDGG